MLLGLVHDVVPFTAKNYRTEADRNHRAVAGLPLLPGVLVNIPMPADAATRHGPDLGHSIDPAKFESLLPALGPEVNTKLRLFYLTIGTDDGLVESWQDARKVFNEKGVKYVWVERPGFGHEWRFWRLALEDFASHLFQPGA